MQRTGCLLRVMPHCRQQPHVHQPASADCPWLMDAINLSLMHCVAYCIAIQHLAGSPGGAAVCMTRDYTPRFLIAASTGRPGHGSSACWEHVPPALGKGMALRQPACRAWGCMHVKSPVQLQGCTGLIQRWFLARSNGICYPQCCRHHVVTGRHIGVHALAAEHLHLCVLCPACGTATQQRTQVLASGATCLHCSLLVPCRHDAMWQPCC